MLSENRGSVAKTRTRIPTMTLIIPTRWKAIRQPGIPMNEVEAIRTDKRPPMMEPKFAVSWSHPKAVPRLLSSVESATRDWIAGVTIARPIPFNPLETAT